MVSPLIEGSLNFGGGRFALGAALQLPSLAATELERKGTFSKEALAEAERFALTEYLTTLAGPRPKGDAARDFYARVARITGLPEEVIAQRSSRRLPGNARRGQIAAATTPRSRNRSVRAEARAASDARRPHARLWRRVRRLCP
jgi:hypothetical protein